MENMALMPQDLRRDGSLEIHTEYNNEIPNKIDPLPERYQRNKKKASLSLGSSLLHSRQLDHTTTDCAESIQTTETDTEA